MRVFSCIVSNIVSKVSISCTVGPYLDIANTASLYPKYDELAVPLIHPHNSLQVQHTCRLVCLWSIFDN